MHFTEINRRIIFYNLVKWYCKMFRRIPRLSGVFRRLVKGDAAPGMYPCNMECFLCTSNLIPLQFCWWWIIINLPSFGSQIKYANKRANESKKHVSMFIWHKWKVTNIFKAQVWERLNRKKKRKIWKSKAD